MKLVHRWKAQDLSRGTEEISVLPMARGTRYGLVKEVVSPFHCWLLPSARSQRRKETSGRSLMGNYTASLATSETEEADEDRSDELTQRPHPQRGCPRRQEKDGSGEEGFQQAEAGARS